MYEPIHTYTHNSPDDCLSVKFASDPPTSKSPPFRIPLQIVPLLRSFPVVLPYTEALPSQTAWFWEIRRYGRPPEGLNAHSGDIYLDISTVPFDVYQRTATGWRSCWLRSPGGAKKTDFLKFPHPRFRDYFLWTTQAKSAAELSLSYITSEEWNSRGGTEADKQVCLLEDLKTFYPSITTAQTLVARREEALQATNGSSSSLADVVSDLDHMSIEEDLCDDGDSNDQNTDEMKSDKFYKPFDVCSKKSLPFNLTGCDSCISLTPPFEPDSIHTLLSQLNESIEKERAEHALTDKLNSSIEQELTDALARFEDMVTAKDVFERAYNHISLQHKRMKPEREKLIRIKDKLVDILQEIDDENKDDASDIQPR